MNSPSRALQNELQKIRKELIDARVVEGHIIPNRLLFTSHAPSQEYPTVAWLPDGIQAKLIAVGIVNFSSNCPLIHSG